MNKAIVVLLFFLFGCAEKITERIVYVDVLVPVRCETAAPVKPVKAKDTILQVVDLINYARELEYALAACKGE